jgi:pimeloyl-ACP methyl ester carboxylesterase
MAFISTQPVVGTMSFLNFLFVLLGSLPSASASSVSCQAVSFSLNFTTAVVRFSDPPDTHNETSVIDFAENAYDNGALAPSVGTVNVSGPFTINGTYCVPSTSLSPGVLQILVHGITYNHSMWLGLGNGEQYNWPTYAASQGYHTLSIDRLGHSNTHPTLDPINLLQAPIQVEILHQLIVAVRTGRRNALSRTFSKVVYVDHSLGSLLSIKHAAKYPNDTDALVLTGYSSTLVFPWTGFPFDSIVSIFPRRYVGTPYGYTSFIDEATREASFYAGSYDPKVAQNDFFYEDTITAGEWATLGLALEDLGGHSYAKPVLVVTGAKDAIFCSSTVSQSCDSILNATSALFPSTEDFSYRVIDNTGHTLVLHRSVQTTFKKTHDWLNGYFH